MVNKQEVYLGTMQGGILKLVLGEDNRIQSLQPIQGKLSMTQMTEDLSLH